MSIAELAEIDEMMAQIQSQARKTGIATLPVPSDPQDGGPSAEPSLSDLLAIKSQSIGELYREQERLTQNAHIASSTWRALSQR